MSQSILVNPQSVIEVTAYFVNVDGQEMQRKHIQKEDIPKYPKEHVFHVIALFKYPTYSLTYSIVADSQKIDTETKWIYQDQKRLEWHIISSLMFAIIDDKGNRTDITKENQQYYLGNLDPPVVSGIYYEFRKKCYVNFF